MNTTTLPDDRVLAAETAYRRDALRAAARPLALPDVVGVLGRLADAVRRTRAATRRTALPRTAPRTAPPRTVMPAALSPRDLPLGHSAVCR